MIISTIKNKLGEAEKIALGELRLMFPYFLIFNGFLLIISGIVGIFVKNADFGVFTGIIVGNIMSALNFYFIGFFARRFLQRRSEARVINSAGVAYAARYLAMFAILWILVTFNLVNPVTAVVPLLYPSFYYKIKAFFNKSL